MTTKSEPAVSRDVSPIMADGFIDVVEAGKFLGLSRATIYQLMDKGELPYCKFRKSRRIPRRALVEYAQSCLVG